MDKNRLFQKQMFQRQTKTDCLKDRQKTERFKDRQKRIFSKTKPKTERQQEK